MKRSKNWKTRGKIRKWLLLRSRWPAEAAMTWSLIMSIRSCAKHNFMVTSLSCQCTHAPTYTTVLVQTPLLMEGVLSTWLYGRLCHSYTSRMGMCNLFFRNYFFLDIHLLWVQSIWGVRFPGLLLASSSKYWRVLYIEKRRFTTFEECSCCRDFFCTAVTCSVLVHIFIHITFVHIFYNLQFVSLCSSPKQGLNLITFAMLSFHFLIMRKATPAWPLYVLEWSNRWPVYNLFTVNLYFSSNICSYLSSDRTLYVAIFV